MRAVSHMSRVKGSTAKISHLFEVGCTYIHRFSGGSSLHHLGNSGTRGHRRIAIARNVSHMRDLLVELPALWLSGVDVQVMPIRRSHPQM
jgi:hypothetical protein